MKKAIALIVDKIPSLEKHLNSNHSMLLRKQALDEVEEPLNAVFLELIWFFENPEEANFDLKWLYNELSDDWLSFALNAIELFFKEDTYLIKEDTNSVIVSDEYLDQAGISRFLSDRGIENFPQNKIATYILRGKFPEPDMIISGKKFWNKTTIDKFANFIWKE